MKSNEELKADIRKGFDDIRRGNEELKRMTEEYRIKSEARIEKLKAHFRSQGYIIID